MNDQQFADGQAVLRHYEYDDGDFMVADIGAGRDASVDVVDGTAIVVVDGAQYEFELPAGRADAFIKNGIVTIEVDR